MDNGERTKPGTLGSEGGGVVRLGLRVKWSISRGEGGGARSLNNVPINPTRAYFFICIISDLAKMLRRYLRKLLRNQRNVLHEKNIDILEEEKFK